MGRYCLSEIINHNHNHSAQSGQSIISCCVLYVTHQDCGVITLRRMRSESLGDLFYSEGGREGGREGEGERSLRTVQSKSQDTHQEGYPFGKKYGIVN